MLGYWRDEAATAEVLVDGWLHTGDVGHVDDDGYLFVVDRKKDLVIRGGFNVYPRDVEDVLLAHPAVATAAVVGRPDEVYGEEVVAFVGLRDGAIATERGAAGPLRRPPVGDQAPARAAPAGRRAGHERRQDRPQGAARPARVPAPTRA